MFCWINTCDSTHVKTAWKKFRELLPVLCSRHLSFKTRGHVYSSCVRSAMLHAIDKAKPPLSAAKWQGNDQIDLQCQAARHCHHQIQWATCAAWHWGSGPHSEGSYGMDMWNTPMVQSRQPLTYRLMESVGLGDQRWYGSSWQWGIAESGSSQLSTLMIDIPGVRSAIRAASQLPGRGPTDVDVVPVPAC